MSGARAQALAIAQVTPYPWEGRREVNEYVEHLSAALAGAVTRVLVLAPSGSRALVRDSRRRSGPRQRPRVAARAGRGDVLAMGQSVPVAAGAPRRHRPLPIDVARTLERLLTASPLDFVHVHEPFAPSAAAAALRHSRALNVGSFHSPTERVLSTQVARRFIQLFFGRLDARMATSDVTRELVSHFFPGDYDVVRPGVDLERFKRRRAGGEVEIAFVARGGAWRPARCSCVRCDGFRRARAGGR